MPTYAYKALALDGATLRGREAASSLAELRALLASRDLILKSARQADRTLWHIRRRPPLQQLAGFNRQFSVLLKAGIPIVEALAILEDRPDQPQLQAAIRALLEDIRQGMALSLAVAKLPQVFEPAYYATVVVGEQSGTLAQSLARYQHSVDLRLRLGAQVSKALTYPLVLMITLTAVLTFLFIGVIPSFVGMYRDLGSELPGVTRALIFIAANLPVIAAVLVSTVLIFFSLDRIWAAAPGGMLQRHRLILRIPLIGRLRRAMAAAASARMLATLMTAGTPLVRALEVTCESAADQHFAAALADVRRSISAGEKMSAALTRHNLFPPASLKMLQAGEASGSLDSMLAEIAAYHESELEQFLTRLTMLIEPALTLVAGGVVGGVIVAMYLPIFSLMEAVR